MDSVFRRDNSIIAIITFRRRKLRILPMRWCSYPELKIQSSSKSKLMQVMTLTVVIFVIKHFPQFSSLEPLQFWQNCSILTSWSIFLCTQFSCIETSWTFSNSIMFWWRILTFAIMLLLLAFFRIFLLTRKEHLPHFLR